MVRRATVAIEDRRFYQHGALDYEGIIRAAFKDIAHGSTALQGASTLTEQVVDNAYLPKSIDKDRQARNLKYKIEQAKLALQLEEKHSKRWILTKYLNVVPYGTVGGETAYGIAAAAQMFFDKPVAKLRIDQVALLAGLPQAPSTYNPFLHPAAARARRNQVLQAMVTAGDITQRKATILAHRPLAVKPDHQYSTQTNPYVFKFIEAQAGADLCPRHPHNCPALRHGVKIYSTLDLHRQAQAQASINANRSLLAEGGPTPASAGLASVQASNGHILALATSDQWSQSQLDYAYQASRQTGSAFKVFALMTLIHDYDGNPNDTYYTSKALPAGWTSLDPTWAVHTDDYVYNGSIPITRATYLSDNTVFAQLVVDLGVAKMNQIARAMGITSPLGLNPSEVLGALTYGTTPLQMADAYATIADGGVHHRATIIDKIVWPDGHVRYFGNSKGTRVFTYGQTYAADPGAQAGADGAGRDRRGTELGLPGSGQDRHRREPRERVVRRLHAADLNRRLGRLPAGQHPDQQRFRRLLRRADLEGLHGVGGRRLLRRLGGAGDPVRGDRLHRPELRRAVRRQARPARRQPCRRPARRRRRRPRQRRPRRRRPRPPPPRNTTGGGGWWRSQHGGSGGGAGLTGAGTG